MTDPGEVFLYSPEDVELINRVHQGVDEMAMRAEERRMADQPDPYWWNFRAFSELFVLLFLAPPMEGEPMDIQEARKLAIVNVICTTANQAFEPVEILKECLEILSRPIPDDSDGTT